MEEQNKVLIKIPKGVVIRDLSNILFVKAEGSYCTLNFVNGDHFVISKNLSQIKLPETVFFRIHASVIINLHYVKRIKDYQVILACLLYTSPSPRDQRGSRMPSSA